MKHRKKIFLFGLAFVSLSVRFSTFAEDPATANRNAIEDCLRRIALRAQVSYCTSRSAGGQSGSFANMILGSVLSWPLNAYGSFVLSSPSANSVTFTGVGIETGRDGTNPVEVEIVVWPDSVSVEHNN